MVSKLSRSASFAFLLLAGCRNDLAPNGLPNQYHPPALSPRTYEEALAQSHRIQEQYSQGYSTIGYNPSILTIPGRPFVAQRSYEEFSRSDKDHPVLTVSFTIARDSAGRIHYESSRRPSEVDVIISDPVAHIQYRYFVKNPKPSHPTAEKCTEPLMRHISGQMQQLTAPSQHASLQIVGFEPQTQASQAPETKEDLGTRSFEGLEAYGEGVTSFTSTRYGTKKMYREDWFSADFGLTLLELKDFEGQNVFSVITHDFVFSEPDPVLFQPPHGYIVSPDVPSCVRLHP